MSEFNNKLNQVREFLQKISDSILNPVRKLLAPIDAYKRKVFAPLYNSWAAYAARNPRESRIVKWTLRLIQLGIFSLFFFILLTWIGAFGKLPSTEELQQIETANASEVYSSDGKLLGKFYTENRTTIKLDSISPYLITALLAIEDKRFFEHSGIDLRSWMRVFKGLATNSSELGGGSTLSQQLAKNLFPREKFAIPGISILINKIKENIIGIKLENLYNKEELLTMYLNTVPFGGNRYGIQVAARYFYNKRPKTLTPDQAATLIGMLKATTALDPNRNPKNSEKRRNLVLSQMLKNKDFRFDSEEMAMISAMVTAGAITVEQYEELIKKPLNATIHEEVGNNEGIGTYFREYLRVKELPKILANLVKEDGTSYNQYTDGLKIYTTLDSRMQTHAEEAVFKHMSYLQNEFEKHWKGYKDEKPWGDDKWIDDQVKRSERYQLLKQSNVSDKDIDSIFKVPAPMKVFTWAKVPVERDTMMTPLDSVRYYFTMLNCGFMAMEHNNGYIKAWVGGTDFRFFKYDHILSKRQVGSTFKPIVYAAALQDSIGPCEFFRNKEVTILDWTPKNSDNSYGGWYSVIGGLTYSTNVIAAQLIEKVGIQKTIDLATKMGVTTTLPREYGISLGAADIPLLDMMKVYGTIANKGLRPEPTTILKILDRYGKVIYDHEEAIIGNTELGPHVQALDTMTAAIMSRMMQSVVVYGTANNLRSRYVPHGDFAGKTGTTQNHADGWFIAFNPKLVTGAWVGGPSPAVRFRNMGLGSGAAMALPIVGNFWYALAIDKNFAKITQEKFVINEKVNVAVSCPFRIGISPDTFNLLMGDTLFRDSLMRSGFKNMAEMAREKFGYPAGDEPDGGEPTGPTDESVVPVPNKEATKPKENKDGIIKPTDSADKKKGEKSNDKPAEKPIDKAVEQKKKGNNR